MNIPLITHLLEVRARNRLRAIMRGSRVLRNSIDPDLVAVIKNALKNHKFGLGPKNTSVWFFGAATSHAELAVRQYLLSRFGGQRLTEALLFAYGQREGVGKVATALPLEWRLILNEHGIPVSHFRSALAWGAHVVTQFLLGFALFVRRLIAGGVRLFWPVNKQLGNFVYFDSLIPGALPQESKDTNSYDIMSWYIKHTLGDKKFDYFCHGIKGVPSIALGHTLVVGVDGPVFTLDRFSSLIRFLIWGTIAVILVIADVLRGRWFYPIMLREAVKTAQVRFEQPKRLAREYLFHNSNFVYRPLWTYQAEKHGSEILMYFYSTNCEPFKRKYGYKNSSNEYYEVMSWTRYMVWDTYQANFIRRSVGLFAKVDVVGPIWFTSSPEELPPLPMATIALFDVQPVRESFYQRHAIEFDYYTPVNSIAFIDDIYTAAKACRSSIVLKRKRKIGSLIHPIYESFVDRITEAPGFITISPEVSASRLIEKCIAVISMPFTSTALIGKALGKPSVYYDPYGMIQKDDRGAHGIEILSGPEELSSWLSKTLESFQPKLKKV